MTKNYGDNPFQDEEDAYQYSDDSDVVYGTVDLDGKPFPIAGEVQVQNLGMYDGRFVIGDPTKDADKYFSVWTQNNWTGGGQKRELNVDSDTNRFNHATLDTIYPNLLTMMLETLSYTITSAAAAYPLGDYQIGADLLFHVAFGTVLCKWVTDSTTFTSLGNLTAVPVNKAVVYDDLLWIPEGSNGYDTWNGAAVTHDATITPVAFVEWDDKLIALGSDGQISVYFGGSWSSPSGMVLRGNREPRNLVVWWTQDRFPAVFVVTNRDVWACDFLQEVLYRTGLQFPVHPDFGLGSAVWQDDQLYVSVGVGVHQLSLGGVVSAMGLDHNNGLPSYLRGAIVDLHAEYNGVLALIEGVGSVATSDTSDLGFAMEETSMFDAGLVVPETSTTARSALMRWNGTGWHSMWESTGAEGTPTRVMVSEADGEYRIWWGYGVNMYTQPLRRSFYNPMQGAELGIDRFALTGQIETGRFDAGMAMNVKLGSHLSVHLDNGSTGHIDISYMTDRTDPDWVSFGTVSGVGNQTLMCDPDGDGWAEGLPFRWIEFKYVFVSADPLLTPIINWYTFHFIKIPLQTKSFQFLVPLKFPESWSTRSAQDIIDHLDRLAVGERYVSFKHGGLTYRVRVASTVGPEDPARVVEGARQVSLIELDHRDDPTEDVDV